jgi:hypothetical protein
VISPDLELARLGGGPPPERPGRLEPDTLVAGCPPGSEAVLGRIRDVMAVVLAHQEGEWPDLERWKEELPAWFVDACVDDRVQQTCAVDRWSLRAWLHWLKPENRRWYWWDASVEPDGKLVVTVLIRERPYLRGALEWLVKSAGGTPE